MTLNWLAMPLFAIGAVGWFCFALLAWWYWVKERNEKERIARMKADVADMMLLFQTMRDVVSQQKKLASEFNHEIETKVGGVKKILATALDKNEKLYERQRGLEQLLEELRGDLSSVQRQVAQAASTHASRDWDAPLPDTAPVPPEALTSLPDSEPEPEPSAPFMALPDDAPPAKPPSPVLRDVDAQPWEHADLDALADNTPLGEPVEEEPLEDSIQPADAEAARDAFRALLDMSAAPAEGGPPAEPNGNGAGGSASVQKRAVAYARAGMNVSQIAQELGVGKGEVRLMLSLAKHAPGEPQD